MQSNQIAKISQYSYNNRLPKRQTDKIAKIEAILFKKIPQNRRKVIMIHLIFSYNNFIISSLSNLLFYLTGSPSF
jgi:hypothetical protein